jgi:hypothetical protein
MKNCDSKQESINAKRIQNILDWLFDARPMRGSRRVTDGSRRQTFRQPTYNGNNLKSLMKADGSVLAIICLGFLNNENIAIYFKNYVEDGQESFRGDQIFNNPYNEMIISSNNKIICLLKEILWKDFIPDGNFGQEFVLQVLDMNDDSSYTNNVRPGPSYGVNLGQKVIDKRVLTKLNIVEYSRNWFLILLSYTQSLGMFGRRETKDTESQVEIDKIIASG